MIDIQFERRAKTVKQLSLIPLVDIMLVLIIYFLVAGSLKRMEILEVEPPLAQSGEELTQGNIVIILGKYDEVLINDELGSEEDILPKVKAELAKNKHRIITIKADNRMKAARLIEVMNDVRQAGGENVTLATQTP
jgi:biopolymer transport protein ExbD